MHLAKQTQTNTGKNALFGKYNKHAHTYIHTYMHIHTHIDMFAD